MMNIGDRIKANTGRNKGQYGIVTAINGNNAYIDFNRNILVNEGFGSMATYNDGYWVRMQ